MHTGEIRVRRERERKKERKKERKRERERKREKERNGKQEDMIIQEQSRINKHV